MRITVACFICLLFSLFYKPVVGQDLHFSQFSETPLLRNPALAGIFNGDIRIQGVNRSQWGSFTSAFQTTSLNGEYKFSVGRGFDYLSIGGQILHDKAGTVAFTSTNILPVINFHKSLSDEKNMYLSAGFMGGLVMKSIDRSKITTNTQYNGNNAVIGSPDGETFTKPNYTYLDGSVGISFNEQIGENVENNFYLGAAYHHINHASKLSFYGSDKSSISPKMVLSGALKMALDEWEAVTIYADYTAQGPYAEIMTGLLYAYKLDDATDPTYRIEAGGYFRFGDALIPIMKLDYHPFILGASYDINISKLSKATRGRGGFELSITYQDFFKKESSSKNATRCPRF